jgi:PAS domain S-box-containing protein
MTDNLRHSIDSGNGSSQNISQGMAEAHDQSTAEVADSPARQSDLALDIQALQIFDSSDDCITVLDLDGRILFMSRGGQVLLGVRDVKPFLHTSWIEFWQGAAQQAASEAIARAVAGEGCSFEGYCPTLNGEPKWWDNKISPVRGIDGNVERLLCISRDITERRQIENERKQAQATLQNTIEELRVAEEELRQQNKELVITRELAEQDRQRYQDLFDFAPDGYVVTDANGVIQEANRAISTLTALDSRYLVNTPLEVYISVPDRPAFRNLLYELNQQPGVQKLRTDELNLQHSRGNPIPVAITGAVILNSQADIVGVRWLIQDITKRKQSVLNAEFLATVTQDLAEASSVEDIIPTIGEQLNRYLQTSICAFVEINESAEVATIHHSWYQKGVPSLVGVYHLAEFVTDKFFQMAKAGQTIIVRDVTRDPRIADPERFARLKIGSFINVPLIRDNEWKFTLGIYHSTPYNWRSNEIELMRELANCIWTKLERTRVEIALRQSQEMFSALVADAPFGVYIIDAEFRFRQANQTAVKAFNIGSLIGCDLTETLRIIWHEPFATEAIHRLRHTLATGEPYYSLPMAEPRADIAEIQSYDWQIHRITLPDGSYGVVCYFYDLSEVKRAEEVMRRNADRDAFLITLNDALRPLTNASEIQAIAAHILGEALGATRVIYIEVDSNGEEVIAHCNYVNGVEELSGRYRLEDY